MSRIINNQFDGRSRNSDKASPLLKPLTILALVLIGLFSFITLIVLMGYGEDLRQKEGGQATPISQSAVGYAALVQFLGDAGFDVTLDPKPFKRQNRSQKQLRVYTPSSLYQTADLTALNDNNPKLIILPKWSVIPLENKPGWVRRSRLDTMMRPQSLSQFLGKKASGIYIGHIPTKDMAEGLNINVANRAHDLDFGELQYFTNIRPENSNPFGSDKDGSDKDGEDQTGEKIDEFEKGIEKLLGVSENNDPVDYQSLMTIIKTDTLAATEKSLLIKLADTRTYILSDPDFVNTMGLSSRSRARAASDIFLAVMADAQLDPRKLVFDLSLHKIGGNPNLVKLMTQPPFLAATLCLFAAAVLIIWQGFIRFGDPKHDQPDYSQGPASLADSTASFITMAGRNRSMGAAYTELIQRSVIRKLGLTGLAGEIVEKRLAAREVLRGIEPKFEDLQQTNHADSDPDYMDLARALVKWKEEMLREP